MRFGKVIICGLFFYLALICLSGCQDHNPGKPKLLLIGLDGASWNVMHPLIDQGRLPNIKRLMDKGCWGDLQTFRPFISEIIWTTIATSKTRAEHGITERYMEDRDTGGLVYVNTSFRKAKSLWNILSENGKRVGIVQYHVSWPAEKVNGVMISNKILPENISKMDDLSNNMSYPDFRSLCSQAEFESFKNFGKSLFEGVEKKESWGVCWAVEKEDKFMVNLSKHLLKTQSFDFFCLYLKGIDIVSHRFWQYLFPEGLDIPEAEIEKYKDIINNYYVWCDKVIGEIIRICGRDTAVMVISDHGFGKAKEEFLFTNVDYLLEVSGIKQMTRAGKTVILKNEPSTVGSFQKNIQITGDLSKEEFNQVREEVEAALTGIRAKETDKPIFRIVKDTKEGFLFKADEPYMKINRQHHLLIQGKQYTIADFLIKGDTNGQHVNPAIIIFSGRNIRANRVIRKANIYDITPTLLYYMGVPIAKDMQGKVLVDAFNRSYIKKHPIQYIDTYETGEKSTSQKPVYSAQEEEAIKARMRALGYMQ